MQVKRNTSRRTFLRNSAMAGVGMWIGSTVEGAPRSPNEKLNVGCIGVGGKGQSDTLACRGENIVALCDVDDNRAARTYKAVPKAEKYKDYRKLLDRKDVDAVTVSTPDHNHAPAAMMAIKQGKHAFVQKPLTKTVHEARALTEAARKYKVATQMGNQGTSSAGLRAGVEAIQAGAIGKVKEIHIWTNRPVWPQGSKAIPKAPPTKEVPKHLAWSEWLGPASDRPFSDKYLPFVWRGFWDFGTGALGAMACHTANLPFWANKLEYPTSFERVMMEGNNKITFPTLSQIQFQFPARGNQPALKLFWYDGWTIQNGKKVHNNPGADVHKGLIKNISNSGSLQIGENGMMYSWGDYGSNWKILGDAAEGFKAPTPSIPRSPGHAREWLDACKGGAKAMSNFDYAGLLTETILLGNLALLVDGKIEWDGAKMRSTNSKEANQYAHYEYRKGYTL